jgi:tetratricopeptide (TPR) repeat protein
MDRIRQLIHEAHRRSVWQVLSIYLVASWVALQVVEIISESAGLPDWAQPFALVLLIIGLPIVLATAVVQEGRSGESDLEGPSQTSSVSPAAEAAVTSPAEAGDRPGFAPRRSGLEPGVSEQPLEFETVDGGRGVKRLFTWRNAIGGGVAAFALLGVLVVGYFAMWSAGIGPVGSLAAQGVFEEGDAVVLAQIENTSDDPTLGDMVTEALRVDLAGSSIMTLVETGRIQDALGRMGRNPDEPLDAELAREVAIRDGFKAVIHGTVGSAGSGYLFVASMQAAESGQVLATFRESAQGPDEVIGAIDKLSQDIREKAGESLRSIKGEEPLENVTTSSLEALKKYAEAERLSDRGEYPRALAALREATTLDPTFAMAYRKIAVNLNNGGGSIADQVEATTRAYELRDRLTGRERYLAEAYYHNLVTQDLEAEIQAYQTVLEQHPDDQAALNNIALALLAQTRLDEALSALERAVNGPGASSPAFTNYPIYLAIAGRHEEAAQALDRLQARYPGRGVWVAFIRFGLEGFKPNPIGAIQAGDDLLALPEAQGGWRAAGYLAKVVGSAQMGRLEEARAFSDQAFQELTDLGVWEGAQRAKAGDPWLEHLARTGRAQGMMAEVRATINMTLDSLPAHARDYFEAVTTLARLGDAQGVEEMLARWRADGIPSATSRAFEEVQRYSEAVLLEASDPEGALAGLNELAREFNCPGCAVWERAELAQKLGRFEEARDLFLAASSGGSQDYMAEPLIRVLVHERLGEVYEGLGEDRKAAEHYRLFAEFWANADPELQPRVERAKARAAALDPGENG